jgi:hypothetical protein
MAAMQRAPLPNTPNVVDELFTDANIVALNEVLVERGISPDRIVTIVMVPGQTMVTPTAPQFRVLYRATLSTLG